MRSRYTYIGLMIAAFASAAAAQSTAPSTPSKPYIAKPNNRLRTFRRRSPPGMITHDIVAQAGTQMRVAVFHDDKRENDLVEVHNASDNIYYVLGGTATLMLGGSLVEPNQISPGEWRSKTATGGERLR